MEAVKVTKQATRTYVKKQLATNQKWATNALLRIFDYQTRTEQENESTHDHNGVGFTGVDGEILASFSKQLIKRGFLSEKQMNIVYKKMPKYWMQIIKLSNEEKLEAQVANYLIS